MYPLSLTKLKVFLHGAIIIGVLNVGLIATFSVDNPVTGFDEESVTTEIFPTDQSPLDYEAEFTRITSRSCSCGLQKRNHNLPDPSESDHGYVIGGVPASEGEFPWVAAITRFQHNKRPRWRVICGAALLNHEYAITAAHCLHNRFRETLEVVFNIKDTHQIDNDTNVIRRKIKRFVVHPEYDPNTQHEDIALVQFKAPVDLRSEKVVPICLPASSSTTYASRKAKFAGFGHTSYGSSSDSPKGENSRILMKVSVPVLSHAECLKTKVPSKKNVTENMICGGIKGKDACINDSGGPLMVRENGRTVVIGLASWGVGCSLEGYPGVYTRVSKYLGWINSESEYSCG